MTAWQSQGRYEYEYDQYCRYTGWCRCIDDPGNQWNFYTGAKRRYD